MDQPPFCFNIAKEDGLRFNETLVTHDMEGYGHAAYAASLSDFGTPRFLDQSKGWILERTIEQSLYRDAMGCYPVFVCEDWSLLEADLSQVEGLVSLSLVTDPLGDYDTVILQRCFPDLVSSFKQHFVIDLSRCYESFVSSHHRRNAREALSKITVDECNHPRDLLNDWIDLYSNLIKRHKISGVRAFSSDSFAKQLRVPGIRVFKADYAGDTVGMILWYAQGSRSYYHLAAYSDVGYGLGASFALFDHSIKYFAQQGFQWLSLGAGAGLENEVESGLTRFKAGWSTGTRTAYLCGRVFDQAKYNEVVLAKGLYAVDYFPAYRFGEFA